MGSKMQVCEERYHLIPRYVCAMHIPPFRPFKTCESKRGVRTALIAISLQISIPIYLIEVPPHFVVGIHYSASNLLLRLIYLNGALYLPILLVS